MLQNIKTLQDHSLAATDGEIGHVKDFYFDDKTWAVRYLVVDTGSWLTGRLVLLSPHAFGCWDPHEKKLHVNLTRQQIERSPTIESHRPVSRQHEIDHYRHYGWPRYWEGGGLWGRSDLPEVIPPTQAQWERTDLHHRDDSHLRSAQSVFGYEIQATDGAIGSLSSMMVDDKSWAIRELVVETGHWYAGKEILIAADKVDCIGDNESKVFVGLTKSDIERTEEKHLAMAHSGNDAREDFPTD